MPKTRGDPLVDALEPVAILDEHLLLDNDGKPLMYLDAGILQKFADRLTKKYQETQDAVPLIDGHTQEGKPAAEQPTILGFAYPPYEVRPLLNTGRKAIFCRMKVYESKVDLVRNQRPRRSVEIWPSRWDIDPIALLGAETPDRYLGPLKLSSSDRSFTRTIGASSMDPTMVGQIGDAVLARLMETAPFKFLTEFMKEYESAKTEEAAPPPAVGQEPPVEGEPLPEAPVEPEGAPEDVPPEDDELADDDEQPPIQKSAGFPSGSNTFPPEEAKIKMQRDRDQLAIQLKNALERIAALEADRQVAIKKARDAQRERALSQLVAEGYELEVHQEMLDTDDFPEDRFQAHTDKIRKQYRVDVTKVRQFPEGDRPIQKSAATTSQADQAARIEMVERARDIALDTGRPFEAVYGEISNS